MLGRRDAAAAHDGECEGEMGDVEAELRVSGLKRYERDIYGEGGRGQGCPLSR